MAKDKKSFIAYADWLEVFEELEDDEAGRLAKHLFKYVNDLNPEPQDKLVRMCFIPIKNALKRDLVKYESIRERNRKNGEKGGRPKKPSGLIGNPEKPQKADSVSDSVNVNEEKIYIYSAFYDSEIESANNTNYTNFVKYLFGENMLKEKLIGVLSIKSQLTFDEYKKISSKCEVNKLKLGQILTKIENDVKYYKGKKSLYRTLLNWAEGRFAK